MKFSMVWINLNLLNSPPFLFAHFCPCHGSKIRKIGNEWLSTNSSLFGIRLNSESRFKYGVKPLFWYQFLNFTYLFCLFLGNLIWPFLSPVAQTLPCLSCFRLLEVVARRCRSSCQCSMISFLPLRQDFRLKSPWGKAAALRIDTHCCAHFCLRDLQSVCTWFWLLRSRPSPYLAQLFHLVSFHGSSCPASSCELIVSGGRCLLHFRFPCICCSRWTHYCF